MIKKNIVLTLRNSKEDFRSIEKVFFQLSRYLFITYFELSYSSSSILNIYRNIVSVRKQQPSLLHISGFDHYLLWYPFKNAILTIHDLEALKRKKGIKRWIFKKLWFDLPIKNAVAVTTISNFTKQELLRSNNYRTPIYVIPNPLTIEVDFEPKCEWNSELKVLHIGTKANKNLIRTIAALENISCELTIIGKLSDVQYEQLLDLGIKYRNQCNLSEEEIIKEYQRCDLLCFTSTYEGFGLPILEAQALGRVVLTSNCTSMPEVAGEGAFLVDPFSVQSIREGILKLIEDRNLREQLIEKGRQNIKRFEPKEVARQYKALYEEVEK